jgi:hypothetical protein
MILFCDFFISINSSFFCLKLLIKIYRNQILSPQQMQAVATNTTTNNNSSHSTYSVYPIFNFVSASMFGKIF